MANARVKFAISHQPEFLLIHKIYFPGKVTDGSVSNILPWRFSIKENFLKLKAQFSEKPSRKVCISNLRLTLAMFFTSPSI